VKVGPDTITVWCWKCTLTLAGTKVDRKWHASRALRKRVFLRDGGRCRYCGDEVALLGAHIDHVVPRAAYGTNALPNLALSCPRCNMEKAAQGVQEFLWSRRPLSS